MRPWNRWQGWLQAIGGAWLIFTPWIFGFAAQTGAAVTMWATGGGLLIVALIALAYPEMVVTEWVAGLGGVWLIASPWIIGFTSLAAAPVNAWVVGAVMVVLTAWDLVEVDTYHTTHRTTPRPHAGPA